MIVLYLMVARIATNLAIMIAAVLGIVLWSHKLNKRNEKCLNVKGNLKMGKSVTEKQPAEDSWTSQHSWNRTI